MIKLIILDVDGVMTNGKKTYDKDGIILSKEFCDKDWTAIKRFKALNIDVVFLSGDKFNYGIARSRNIPFWHNITPKETYLNKICQAFNVTPFHSVAYVGDDLFDVEIAKLVKYAFCPLDAVAEMKEICTQINSSGGNNVIMHLFEYLVDLNLIPYCGQNHMDLVYRLDSKEIKHV